MDGLAGDPVGQSWDLTPKAYYAVGQQAASWGAPLLLLGGGGYNSSAAACAWACALAGLTGRPLPGDVPDHPYLDKYGPSYVISEYGRPVLSVERNDATQVQAACGQLLEELGTALLSRQKAGGGSRPLGKEVEGNFITVEGSDSVPAKRLKV